MLFFLFCDMHKKKNYYPKQTLFYSVGIVHKAEAVTNLKTSNHRQSLLLLTLQCFELHQYI